MSNSGRMSALIAKPEHIPKMVDVLEKSFVNISGVTEWMVKRDHRYAQRMGCWFETLLSQAIPFNHVYYEPENQGVAIWYPPKTLKIGFIEQILWIPKLLNITGISQFRTRALGLLTMSKRHPREPHFYLALIGTAPCKRRKGVGSFMVDLVLGKCKDNKIPVYVESNDYAFPFYKRHGFQTLSEYLLPNSNIRMTSMWLNP